MIPSWPKSDEVAVVHVSLLIEKTRRRKRGPRKAKMNWPLILGSDRKASGMAKFSDSEYIPEYRLVDAKGDAVPLPEGVSAIEKAVDLADQAAAAE